jgi:hypothetical protein
MKQEYKVLGFFFMVVILSMCLGGFVVEKFRRDPLKVEYRKVEKEVKALRDSILVLRKINDANLKQNKKKYNDVTQKYKKAATIDYTDSQLDSLRAEFARKSNH